MALCLWVTPKDYSLAACTVSCKEWGLPMYAYFMCSFACSGFRVSYPLIYTCQKLNSITALFPATSNQSIRVCGERASDRFYWSSPFAAKQSPKSSRVCTFQEVQMLRKFQNKCWKSHYHLALLTMLSALRHGWGVLALCVEVFQQSAKPHSYCRS